jgi:hypothetical protein
MAIPNTPTTCIRRRSTYTHNRTILVNGIPFELTTASVTVANIQPVSNPNELAEAARIAGIRSGEVAHGNMPPFITRHFPEGTSYRILHIYITSPNSSRSFYVNMNNKTVESPPHPAEKPLACTAPPPGPGPNSGKGVPGTANFNIANGLWAFQATRPSASTGTDGSGIELRNVKYEGKTMLFPAHVPIRNVEYHPPTGGCGPEYRDWQYDEWPLQCSATLGTKSIRGSDGVAPQPKRYSIIPTPTEVISWA